MAQQQPRQQPPPQQQQQRIFINLANLRSIFSSRWTDVDLMYVLLHANDDFTVAGNTIARHEATGQPPEELIRMLRGGGVVGQQVHAAVDSSSYTNHIITRRHSHVDGSGGERPVTLDRSVSLGTHPRHTTPTIIERGGVEPDASFSSCVDGRSGTAIPPMTIRQGMVPYAVTGQQPEATAVAAYPSSMLSSNSLLGQKIPSNRDEVLRQLASRQIPGAMPVKPPKARKPPSTQEINMLNTQACIEASLKEKRKPLIETDPDDVALSYAVNASKDTFNEDCQRRELRNSLETRMVQMTLKESLTDPVKKTEEELVNEAIQRSLSDSVQKSEDELIDEACANSLKDPIRKSEEDLVQEAMQNSLKTMSKDEELVEAVMRQSLDDAYCFDHFAFPQVIDDTLSYEDVAKKPSMESVLEKRRRSTSTTCKLSLLEDDDVCSESLSFGATPPSRPDALLEDPGRFLDSKMPAIVSSSDNLNVSSEVPSSEEHNVKNEELRSLSVEGASFSIVNGIYEEVMETNTFTRRVEWEGTIATASIYRATSTQGRKEWVLCLTNYNGFGMDVILFTAAADTLNEDTLPSPSTVWVATNIVQSIVQGSVVTPPKVSENLK